MRPRELLGVVVRGIGIWLLAAAATDGLLAVWKFNGGAASTSIPAGEDIAFALGYFIPGIVLLLLADPIVWLLYGLPPKVSDRTPAGSE